MYVCMCVYVCMYVCMCVCMCVYFQFVLTGHFQQYLTINSHVSNVSSRIQNTSLASILMPLNQTVQIRLSSEVQVFTLLVIIEQYIPHSVCNKCLPPPLPPELQVRFATCSLGCAVAAHTVLPESFPETGPCLIISSFPSPTLYLST